MQQSERDRKSAVLSYSITHPQPAALRRKRGGGHVRRVVGIVMLACDDRSACTECYCEQVQVLAEEWRSGKTE